MGKIIEQILSNTKKFKSKEAYFYFENDEKRVLTFGDFRKLLFSFYQKISEFQFVPGDLVILVGENSPRWPAAYLGAHMLGLTVVHADSRFSQLEFTTITKFSAPKLILCDRAFEKNFSAELPKLILEDVNPQKEQIAPQIIELFSDQPMSIIFTSGTTGDPKGVMLSEANYLSNLKIFETQKHILSHKDRMLGLLPSHHVYPFLGTVLAPLYLGASLIYPKSLKGEDIFGALKEFNGTVMIAIPKVLELFSTKIFERVEQAGILKRTIFRILFNVSTFFGLFRINLGKKLFGAIHKNFPHFRFFACGGAKLDAMVFKRLKGLGFKVIEAYGLTETSPIAAMNSYYAPVAGSVGKAAIDVSIKIEKDNDNDQMEHGEICIKGPNVMMGYYKRPDLTAEVIKDGWFHSGDLGYLDKMGRVFITGRKKEVIILSNGKNIYPDELEIIYNKSSLIAELCVTLLKEGSKEYLTAVVVPNTEEFVRRKCMNYYQEIKFELEKISHELPSYQRINKIEILSQELPQQALGKLKRFKVDETVKEKAQARKETKEDKDVKNVDPVCQFIKQTAKLEKMPSLDDNLEIDLGLDSLTKIELFSALEQKYGITLKEEDMINILTVSDIIAHVKGESKGDSPSGDLFLARQVTSPPSEPLEHHVSVGNSLLGMVMRFFLYLIFKLIVRLFFKIKVEGSEHLKNLRSPFIIAPNHNSLVDGIIMYTLLPFSVVNRCFWLSLPQYFGIFPLSLVRKVSRVILTGTTDTTMTSLKYSYQSLKSGEMMCVFPEGRRSADGNLNPPKLGIGVVATESNAALLPVYIEGADKVLSLSNPGFRPARIRVRFLPPIESGNDPKQLLEKWKDTLQHQVDSR